MHGLRRCSLKHSSHFSCAAFFSQVQNLSLYISRTKFRPLAWRTAHPCVRAWARLPRGRKRRARAVRRYVLVDRYEDVTDPVVRVASAGPRARCEIASDGARASCAQATPRATAASPASGAWTRSCSRGVCATRVITSAGWLAGSYVRGTNLKDGVRVHMAGAGDFSVACVGALWPCVVSPLCDRHAAARYRHLTVIPDPCPLPANDPSKVRLCAPLVVQSTRVERAYAIRRRALAARCTQRIRSSTRRCRTWARSGTCSARARPWRFSPSRRSRLSSGSTLTRCTSTCRP